MTTNSTNSTHCSAPLPENNPFIVAIDSSSPASYVIGSVEENTYKPAFKLNTDGIRTLPYQPFFNAYLTINQLAQTGTGRTAALVANTIISNIGEHYNTTTGLFTAPVAGVYHFDANIRLASPALTGTTSKVILHIIIGSYNYEFHSIYGSTYGSSSFSASRSAFMEANQTAQTALDIAGMQQNYVDFYGRATGDSLGDVFSSFSGYLIG